MKKIFAILILSVLIFNWIGYRFLVYYLENKANASFEARLDNNKYDQSQLVSIKIPVTHLPDYTNSKFFERIDGQIEIKGVVYNYVKSRLFNDSLELLCIPNSPVMNILHARNDFFSLINDLQHPGHAKKSGNDSGSSKIFFAEYFSEHIAFDFSAASFNKRSISFTSSPEITSCSISLIDDPPENA